VSGVPAAFAASATGFRSLGVFTPLSRRLFVSVIAWPFRLRHAAMIIGFFGEPRSPSVDAYGMP
jgi:hypothetical protein